MYYDNAAESVKSDLHSLFEQVRGAERRPLPIRFEVLRAELAPPIKRKLLQMLGRHAETKAVQYARHVMSVPSPIVEVPQSATAATLRRAHACLQGAIYGQADAKAAIVRSLSVNLRNPSAPMRPIALCGPPGVGKTALSKLGVAKALGRAFYMLALGAQDDVAVLLGHSYTYEGATPGGLLAALASTRSAEPVVLLDEIDKVSSRHANEVEHALVHLTDTVQNHAIVDRYLGPDVPLDMSKVLFMCTMNDRGSVSDVLLDRMEVVTMRPYEESDKVQIVQRHLLPKACERVSLPRDAVRMSDDAVRRLVRLRSAASGVRYLQRAVEQLVHEAVLLKAGLDDIVPCQFVRGPLPWQHGRVRLTDAHVDVRGRLSEATPPEHMYM
jgi:ATP-dependent Lon protease